MHEETKPVSIVTGAGSGIGRAIANRLGKLGPVVLVGRRSDSLLETGSNLGEQGNDWIAISADITLSEDRAKIISETISHFGKITHLVNNAAIGTCAPLVELEERQINELIKVNLTAPLLLTRMAIGHVKQSQGCIVSIGSQAAIDPFPGLGAYGCTKSGLEGIARLIASEYPTVRAYTVHPGAVETDMLRSIVSKDDLPTDQVLRPDDIAMAVEQFILGNRNEPNGSSIVVAKS